MKAPVLQVGDKLIVKGFNEARWQAMLDEAGYPKTPAPRAAAAGSRAPAPRHRRQRRRQRSPLAPPGRAAGDVPEVAACSACSPPPRDTARGAAARRLHATRPPP